MRVIIAGSRGMGPEFYPLLERLVALSGFEMTEVVSGTARGADRLGERWAAEYGVPVKRFPANWDRYGRAAGSIRNWEMREYADGLIAVWDGRSRGTSNMIGHMRSKAYPPARVFVWTPQPGEALAALTRVVRADLYAHPRRLLPEFSDVLNGVAPVAQPPKSPDPPPFRWRPWARSGR